MKPECRRLKKIFREEVHAGASSLFMKNACISQSIDNICFGEMTVHVE
jgi:hypothetical protein